MQRGNLVDRRHGVPRHPQAVADVVSGDVVCDQPEERRERSSGLQRVLGLGSYETAWTRLHKLRRAMVRPARERLTGEIEIDETYVGGPEEGKRGRETENKAIVVVATEKRAHAIGRIRLRRIKDVAYAGNPTQQIVFDFPGIRMVCKRSFRSSSNLVMRLSSQAIWVFKLLSEELSRTQWRAATSLEHGFRPTVVDLKLHMAVRRFIGGTVDHIPATIFACVFRRIVTADAEEL